MFPVSFRFHPKLPNPQWLVHERSNSAEHHQDQDNNKYQADPATAVIARAVEAAAADTLKPPSNAITKMISRIVPRDIPFLP